jgi:NADP-dependent 3-hydroxy acid dehydrogenase YdfG
MTGNWKGSELQGRVVAVTGASRGIGLAVAADLAERGATVIAGARHLAGSGTAGQDGPAPEVIGATFMTLDVTDPASVAAFAAAAIEAGVDSLVNNAGVGSFGPIEEITLEEYRRVMDTNVLGTLLVTGALVPHFRARHQAGQGGATVINVTSDVSARTFGGGALYTASKSAQRAVTRALAAEGQAYGLRVSEIRSGMVDTYFAGNVPGSEERREHLSARDVADSVRYALSAPSHVRIDEILLHPVVQPVEF